MPVTLNRRAFGRAKELIEKGSVVFDERDAWSEHRPSASKETEFFASTVSPSTANGIWESMTNDLMTPRDTTNFSMGISRMSIGAACSRKIARANTNTMTSRTRQRTCTE